MIQTAPENTIITRTPIPTPEKLLDPRMNTSWFILAIVSMAIIKQAYVLLLLVVWRGRGMSLYLQTTRPVNKLCWQKSKKKIFFQKKIS